MRKHKCLYYTQQVISTNDGASEKVLAQCEAIRRLGIECQLAFFTLSEKGWMLLVGDKVIAIESKYKSLYVHLTNHMHENGFDLMYVRYGASAGMVYNRFLKTIARQGIYIYLEIPTYPYDGEHFFSSIKSEIKYYEERIFRLRLRGIVHRIVTFSQDKEIFGIPTINISNAPARELPIKDTTEIIDSIQMIAVANLAFWHGYDRLIRGLGDYYKKPHRYNVYLTIAGKGDLSYCNELKLLTDQLELNDYVEFVGSKSSLELDAYFNRSHLAIGCLGCHRKNIVEVKSLKNVEYAMRGIPMVYSEENTDFDNRPYVLKVSPDETDIDVNTLCSFVERLELSSSDIHESVRDFTWANQMHKVFGGFV